MSSLQPYHTFKLDSHCDAIVDFQTTAEFFANYDKNIACWILGGGSNTLFLEDYQGKILVNRITGIEMTETPDAYHLKVGAGENWHNFVTHCLHKGWYGMENLALIPGCVGAAPIQNIGAYGLEVGQFISRVECVRIDDKAELQISREQCQFGYRDSIFKQQLADKVLITHVVFELPKISTLETSYGELAAIENPTPQSVYDEVIRVRQAKLPDVKELGNAGSFFKNPVIKRAHYDSLKARYPNIPGFSVGEQVKVPAAWLLDQLGFKGKTVNKVRCHPTQPLVLTNLGGATGDDVVTLARQMVGAVKDTFSIMLEPEVRLVGKQGLITL